MGFYAVLYRANKLIEQRDWRLCHCRRSGQGVLRYYVIDRCGNVLAPEPGGGRGGMTLAQLLQWLAHLEDVELTTFAMAQLSATQQGDPALAA